MQRAQPDDYAWHAGVRPDPMIRGPREEDATGRFLHAPTRDKGVPSQLRCYRLPDSKSAVRRFVGSSVRRFVGSPTYRGTQL